MGGPPDKRASEGTGTGLRRELGTLDAYAALIGILVGAGIYRVTADASKATGASVVLGYVVLAPVVLATAVPYAVFARTEHGRGPGGDYAHIRSVFRGAAVPFLTGWLKIVSYLGAAAFLALVLADYTIELAGLVGVLEPDAIGPAARLTLATGYSVLFGAVHCFGVRWFGRVQVWLCVGLGLSILVLVLPGLFAIDPSNFRPLFPGGRSGFLASLPPLFFAYAGFEALAHTAGEVRESHRRLPGVFLRGILVTTLVFVSMSAVVVGVLGAPALAASRAPMADAAARFLPGAGAAIVALGGIFAAATSLNATLIVPARLGVTFARDGHLPAPVGWVHAGTGAPIVATVAVLGLTLILLWTGQFLLALNIAVLALMSVYAIHGVALLQVSWHAARTRTSWLWIGRIVATVASIAALVALISFVVAGDLETIGALGVFERWGRDGPTSTELLVAWTSIGCVLLWASRRRRGTRDGCATHRADHRAG